MILCILVSVIGYNELCEDYDYPDIGLNYCRSAAKQMNTPFRVTDTSEDPPEYKTPKHCYMQQSQIIMDNVVWYNKDPNGKRHKGFQPVCERKFDHSQLKAIQYMILNSKT